MGRQDVLITMFIFGALRIIKAGFTQRREGDAPYLPTFLTRHQGWRVDQGWIFSQQISIFPIPEIPEAFAWIEREKGVGVLKKVLEGGRMLVTTPGRVL